MSSTMTRTPAARPRARTSAAGTAYFVLTVLGAVAILLQGLWAGLFLQHDGERDAAAGWIDAHARGGEVSIVLTLAALVVAVVRLRQHRALMLGTAGLLVLLALESYLGGLIRDAGKDTLTAIHVPLALAIMALSVWLPFRSRAVRLPRSSGTGHGRP
jgi:F0F1-type ATP synthase assembly protein I